MRRHILSCVLLFALAVTARAADAPRLVLSKYFKGSTPETVIITIEKSGAAMYREAADDDNPLKFQLTAPAASEVFALAAKLDNFKDPLESGLKVAQMGLKTFRYENGSVVQEAKFNYSINPDAQALARWFEKMVETEQNFIVLDRSIHFDKLGVDRALLNLESSYVNGRLIDPSQFFPLLDRVSKNESFLHMDRELASRLTEEFRKPREKSAQ